jgi:hypothetical protein
MNNVAANSLEVCVQQGLPGLAALSGAENDESAINFGG